MPSSTLTATSSSDLLIRNSTFKPLLSSSISVNLPIGFRISCCQHTATLFPSFFKELAKEYAGKAKVYKLNTDDSAEKSVEYRISSIPTIIIFKDGKPQKQLIGLQSKEELKKQEEYQLYIKEHPEVKVEEEPEQEVVHEDNDWGISLVSSESNDVPEDDNADLNLAHGVKVAYTIPSKPMKEAHQETELDETSESLDDLMNKMKNI